MPSTSRKQARTMAAAAHDAAFAERMGIPQSVAQEFNQADAGTARLRSALKANTFLRKHKRNKGGR